MDTKTLNGADGADEAQSIAQSIAVDFDITEKSSTDYALAPCGFFYNRRLREGSFGDVIEDWNGNRARIVAVGKIDTRLQTTDMLSRLRYNKPILRMIRDWKTTAVLFGNSREAVSDNECLFITYERI